MISIEQAKARDFIIWDKFLENIDSATLFHTSLWGRLLENSYKNKYKISLVLAKDETDQILGGLPLIQIHHSPLLSSLVSVPFGHGGVICADDTVCRNLSNYDFGNRFIVIKIFHSQKHNVNLDPYAESGFEFFDNGSSYYLDLLQTFDKIWMNYDKRMRNSVRKAMTNNILIKEIECDDDLIAIEELYKETMLRTGGDLTLLPIIINLIKNRNTLRSHFFLADYKKEIIAFVSILIFNKSAYYWAAGSSKENQKYGANYLLQNYSIKWLKEKGFSYYCLGGAEIRYGEKKESLDRFKRRWGGDKVQSYLLKKYLNPLGQIIDKASSLWRR